MVNNLDSSQPKLRSDARRNHQALVAAAREVFAEQGPDASLEEIARRAGVGTGTFYRHFPSRSDIQEAVMTENLQSMLHAAEALRDAPEPAEAVERYLRLKLQCSRDYRGLGATVMVNLADERPGYSDLILRIRACTTALLQRAQAAGRIRADITQPQLMKLVHGIALATESSEHPDIDAEKLLEIALDGLRGPAEK